MPIKQIEIKAFKSIVNQTVDLGQLNVFIGTNGAGKSNFLEAVGVLSCAMDGQVSYSRLAERGVRLSQGAGLSCRQSGDADTFGEGSGCKCFRRSRRRDSILGPFSLRSRALPTPQSGAESEAKWGPDSRLLLASYITFKSTCKILI